MKKIPDFKWANLDKNNKVSRYDKGIVGRCLRRLEVVGAVLSSSP